MNIPQDTAATAGCAQPTGSQFRAGDHVKHGPSGEEWELACDEERGEVMPSGWPMCIAKAEHCTLIKSATDEKRAEVLKSWSEQRGHDAEKDMRTRTARRQVSSANVPADSTAKIKP